MSAIVRLVRAVTLKCFIALNKLVHPVPADPEYLGHLSRGEQRWFALHALGDFCFLKRVAFVAPDSALGHAHFPGGFSLRQALLMSVLHNNLFF